MSNGTDDLGDRMKLYEMVEAGRRFMPLLPIIARIDGRRFSRFTAGLDRPYDRRLSDLMTETTRFLVDETGARCGYTQSDEITLAWLSDSHKSQVFFDGRVQKMVSQLGALASVYFNSRLRGALGDAYANKLPTFDARVWSVPNPVEGANVFLWREQDATKNSVSAAARYYYSDKQLFGKGRSEQMEMLFRAGVNWNDFPAFFKRGVYVQRRTTARRFTADELEKLPPKHDARKNPDLIVERSDCMVLDMPPFGRVTNRPEVIFFGAEPATVEYVAEVRR